MDLKRLSPIRRRFLELLLAIAVVHGVAIGLYYGLDIPLTGARARRWFGWGWMAVTVAVVLVGLQRMKRARRAR